MLVRVLLFVTHCLASASSTLDVPTLEIAPNVNMPVLSIGTGGLESADAAAIVSNWLGLGGRAIDTAVMYRDQAIVAKAISTAGIARKDLFITTKIPGCIHAEEYVAECLRDLGTDYIDLLLIHSPVCMDFYWKNCSAIAASWSCPSTWATLEKLHAKGVLKAIGVSNFQKKDLEPLLKTASVIPAVNQIQYNVLLHHDETTSFSKAHNITVEAYSPLGRSNHSGDILGNPVVKSIASAHNVSAYQVALKWILQHGHVLTFQSTSQKHQASDADLFSFGLSDGEMSKLDGLQSGMEVVV